MRNTSRAYLITLFVSTLFFHTSSYAENNLFQERSYYVGLGVSQFSGKSREVNFGDFISPTLVVGIDLAPHLGLEFRASGSSSNEKASDSKNYKLDSHYGGYLLAKYPFEPDKFSGYLRLGISNLKITGESNTDLKANGKFSYGLGFQIRVSKHFALAIDAEKVLDSKIDGIDSNIDSISLVLHRYF